MVIVIMQNEYIFYRDGFGKGTTTVHVYKAVDIYFLSSGSDQQLNSN